MTLFRTWLAFALLLFAIAQGQAQAPFAAWKHSGSLYVLTTPKGANLPASASEKDFPLLVRLHKDFFDFSQAKAKGEDLRFATPRARPCPTRSTNGTPSRQRQHLGAHPENQGQRAPGDQALLGQTGRRSESDGKAVFNESNGYLSVWHLTDPTKDAVGTLASTNQGTTATQGIIGAAAAVCPWQGNPLRRQHPGYPAGSDSHTSEAWFRADQSNGRVLAWGAEKAQGKVVMQLASPPHIQMDCYFSGANVSGASKVPMAEWVHVVHTYKKGESRVYVNGRLDGVSTAKGSPLAIPTSAKMWIGGWYNNTISSAPLTR